MPAAGRLGALVELLDPDVSWCEYLGPRQAGTLRGAEAVTRFLESRITSGCLIELTGIAKTGRTHLELGYTEPWWLGRYGLRARLAYYLLGDARQSATVDRRIARIENHATYFAPRAFQAEDAAQSDLIGLLRR